MPYELITPDRRRRYLTVAEKTQFISAAQSFNPIARTFCNMLANTGCLISEALNMQHDDIDFVKGEITVHSLRKRKGSDKRQIPLSNTFLRELQVAHTIHIGRSNNKKPQKLWSWSRSTGYRRVKTAMKKAGIEGLHATPIGLRHSFGIHCVEKEIPLNFIQKWLGHSSMDVTCMYLIALNQDERTIAGRLWQ